MENYEHLCLYERQRIQRYLRKQKSLRFIADKLERSASSVSDEIKNNSVNGVYDAKTAHHKAYVKRKYSKVQCMKVSTDKEIVCSISFKYQYHVARMIKAFYYIKKIILPH